MGWDGPHHGTCAVFPDMIATRGFVDCVDRHIYESRMDGHIIWTSSATPQNSGIPSSGFTASVAHHVFPRAPRTGSVPIAMTGLAYPDCNLTVDSLTSAATSPLITAAADDTGVWEFQGERVGTTRDVVDCEHTAVDNTQDIKIRGSPANLPEFQRERVEAEEQTKNDKGVEADEWVDVEQAQDVERAAAEEEAEVVKPAKADDQVEDVDDYSAPRYGSTEDIFDPLPHLNAKWVGPWGEAVCDDLGRCRYLECTECSCETNPNSRWFWRGPYPVEN